MTHANATAKELRNDAGATTGGYESVSKRTSSAPAVLILISSTRDRNAAAGTGAARESNPNGGSCLHCKHFALAAADDNALHPLCSTK